MVSGHTEVVTETRRSQGRASRAPAPAGRPAGSRSGTATVPARGRTGVRPAPPGWPAAPVGPATPGPATPAGPATGPGQRRAAKLGHGNGRGGAVLPDAVRLPRGRAA